MPRPGRSTLRRIARWNRQGACVLCTHYLAEGKGPQFRNHVERDHVPEDFGLSPLGEVTG